jgi:hypothetical protein
MFKIITSGPGIFFQKGGSTFSNVLSLTKMCCRGTLWANFFRKNRPATLTTSNFSLLIKSQFDKAAALKKSITFFSKHMRVKLDGKVQKVRPKVNVMVTIYILYYTYIFGRTAIFFKINVMIGFTYTYRKV